MNNWVTLNIIGYILIISISFYGLMTDRLPFSLRKIFWIFCLYFMGAAPLLQYLSGSFPFPWMHNSDKQSSFAVCNTIIILCMLLYHFIYQKNIRKNENPDVAPKCTETSLERFKTVGLIIFCAAIVLQYFLSGSLWNRNAAENNIIIQNSSLNLLADKTMKGIVLYFCLTAMQLYKDKKISLPFLCCILGLSFITNFPAAVPRYWIATLYVGLLLSGFRHLFARRKYLFNLLMTCGLLLIFPLFNLARMKKAAVEEIFLSRETTANGLYQLFKNAFCGQDFDAYASFRNTIIYVQQNGLSMGKQLFTDVLFFIPRTIWPGKSIGSGAIVNMPKPGSDFTNYSSPLIAEGYIDFGIIGSLAFIALFAFLSCRYDHQYWKSGQKNLLTLLYPSFIGMSFFILRGDLLSSFAYTAGIAFSAWLCHRVLTSKNTQTHV